MPTQSRQLAAIMFTDIVGYTKLMGEDEQKAFELLKKNRAVQRPLIEKFNGRWLKEIGDGVLASFSTVTDAVYCAKEIQRTCQAESDLNLRIGIHLGEVVFEGDDVFGDGVNIASRLEPLAPVGGILVSESVHRNLGNKQGIETLFVREESLKNVKDPIKTYEVRVEGIESPEPMITTVEPPVQKAEDSISFNAKKLRFASLAIIIVLGLVYFFYSRQGGEETQLVAPEVIDKSIAVLPFANDSPDPDNEYFCNGMFDEIITHLQKIGELNVKSRTSVEQYRNPDRDIREIAEELETAFLVEGSVRKAGDDLRITVQLIDAKTGNHLWAETYDGKYTDKIFEFQSNIAKKVAEQLEITLTTKEERVIETPPTENLKAYDFYLRARQNHYNYTLTGDKTYFDNGITLYQRAQKEDPTFALPLTGRAGLYWSINNTSVELAQQIILDSVLILSNQAIAIDPELAQAYNARGTYYNAIGEYDKGFLENKKALELSPNNYWFNYSVGHTYFQRKNYIYGLQLMHKGEKLGFGEANLIWTYHMLGYIYLGLDDTEQAVHYWDASISLQPDFEAGLNSLFDLAMSLKQWDRANTLLQKISLLQPTNRRTAELSGIYDLLTKNSEKALDNFEKAMRLSYDGRDYYEHVLIGNHFHGIALWLNGREEEGEKMLKETLASYLDRDFLSTQDREVRIAAIHAFLGNKQEAYSWLHKSNWTYTALYEVQQDLWFSNISGEQEFQDLVNAAKEEKKKIREEIARLKVEGDWEI